MPRQTYIVDSLNVIHANQSIHTILRSAGLEAALGSLANLLLPLHDELEIDLFLVVDSSKAKVTQQPVFNEDSFSFIFAPAELTADGLIEQWVFKFADPRLVTVATGDRAIQNSCLAAGASILSPRQLFESVVGPIKPINLKSKSLDQPFNNPFCDLT